MPITLTSLPELLPSPIVAGYGGAEGVIQAVLSDIMDGAWAEWDRLARTQLHSTMQPYRDGLNPVDLQPGIGIIDLVGDLPNAIEQGQEAYDMHDTLLGPNVPVAPLGQKGKREIKGHPGMYYRAIPFRHGTPGSKGAAGTPMGQPYTGMLGAKAARKLGREIYKQAQALAPTTGMPGGGTQWGGRLAPGGYNWQTGGGRWQGAPKLKPHHSTDIYAGMVREEKTYRNATQNTYTTFRVISDLVPDKWQRKATQGVHFCDQVEDWVEKNADKVLDAFVEAFK